LTVSGGNSLCANIRQAGGCDGDDLSQTAPDPGRRAPKQCYYLLHVAIPAAPAGQIVPQTAQDANVVLAPFGVEGAGKIATVPSSYWPMAVVLLPRRARRRAKFSPPKSGQTTKGGQAGANPNACSKRLT
jgi:hypothetical protein